MRLEERPSKVVTMSRREPGPRYAHPAPEGVDGRRRGVHFFKEMAPRIANDPDSDGLHHIFSRRDAPLPKLDTSLLALPDRTRALAMITRSLESTNTSHRFLHRTSVERWLDALIRSSRSLNSASGDRSRHAVVMMLFALASDESESDSDLGYLHSYCLLTHWID